MRYVFAVAGCNQPVAGADTDSGEFVKEVLPTVVDITVIPDLCWPLMHAAFERDDLVGLWWYAPASEAVPVIEAAIARLNDNPGLASLVDRTDRRGFAGNKAVLQRIVSSLNRYPDNVIAVGVEDV